MSRAITIGGTDRDLLVDQRFPPRCRAYMSSCIGCYRENRFREGWHRFASLAITPQICFCGIKAFDIVYEEGSGKAGKITSSQTSKASN